MNNPDAETPLPTVSIGTPAHAIRDPWRVLRPLAHRDFRVLFGAVVLSIFAAGMWAVVMVYTVMNLVWGVSTLPFALMPQDELAHPLDR